MDSYLNASFPIFLKVDLEWLDVVIEAETLHREENIFAIYCFPLLLVTPDSTIE